MKVKILVDHNDSIITTGYTIDYDKMAPYLAQADFDVIMNQTLITITE